MPAAARQRHRNSASGDNKKEVIPASVPLVRGRERPPSQRYEQRRLCKRYLLYAGEVALQTAAETGAAVTRLDYPSASNSSLSARLPCVHVDEALS